MVSFSLLLDMQVPVFSMLKRSSQINQMTDLSTTLFGKNNPGACKALLEEYTWSLRVSHHGSQPDHFTFSKINSKDGPKHDHLASRLDPCIPCSRPLISWNTRGALFAELRETGNKRVIALWPPKRRPEVTSFSPSCPNDLSYQCSEHASHRKQLDIFPKHNPHLGK